MATTTRFRYALIAGILTFGAGVTAAVAAMCPAAQPQPLLPTDIALCHALDPVVRDPSALPLARYELKLLAYFTNFCHRDAASGWVRDKFVRDTGPNTTQLVNGTWQGKYNGTHAPVVIWYSKSMHDWIKENRAPADEHAKTDKAPVPDGAMMVKEMYPAPASKCAAIDPVNLLPTSGAAIMIRDSKASHDGWFWGWFGWSGWAPDYPANNAKNSMPNMGFAQYCMNCHASARDNMTFASTKNIQGEPGLPLVFLSQDEDPTPVTAANHPTVVLPGDDAMRLGQPLYSYNTAFTDAFTWTGDGAPPSYATVSKMPSETYDETYVPAGGPTIHNEYLTSSQCLGCHDAGSTGLQFDMTVPDGATGKLWNHSPYATWRTSPMGLAGRDPIFFAQLASETQTFHADMPGLVENTCLGCHGIMGQRQFGIDTRAGALPPGGCGALARAMVDAVPWPADKAENPHVDSANYGALARDGISCLSCHRMVLGEAISAAVADLPQNACVVERQKFLNPDNTGFAKTFTGSFLVGAPDKIFGPFKKPKVAPMQDALGSTPVHSGTLAMSEPAAPATRCICRSCTGARPSGGSMSN